MESVDFAAESVPGDAVAPLTGKAISTTNHVTVNARGRTFIIAH